MTEQPVNLGVEYKAPTPFRMLFCSLDAPKPFQLTRGAAIAPGSVEKYNATFIVPADDPQVPLIRAALEKAAAMVFGKDVSMTSLGLPWEKAERYIARKAKGDPARGIASRTVSQKVQDAIEGSYLLKSSSVFPVALLYNANGKVAGINQTDKLALHNSKSIFYPGAFARFELRFKAWESPLGAGVASYLGLVYATGGGEALGGRDLQTAIDTYQLEGHAVDEDPTRGPRAWD